MLQYMEKFTVDDTFELKNQKMCTKEKYYNVLQQPSALLEKIFYVLTQFLVCFFPTFSLKIWHTVQIDEL